MSTSESSFSNQMPSSPLSKEGLEIELHLPGASFQPKRQGTKRRILSLLDGLLADLKGSQGNPLMLDVLR